MKNLVRADATRRWGSFGCLLLAVSVLGGCAVKAERNFNVDYEDPVINDPRPSFIEVRNWDDRREFIANDTLFLSFLPLYPFGVRQYQDDRPLTHDVPLNRPRPTSTRQALHEQKESYKHPESLEKKMLESTRAAYEIPARMAREIKDSGISKQTLLQGRLYFGEPVAVATVSTVAPESDVVLNLNLDRFQVREVNTFYGLTPLLALVTFGLLEGGSQQVDYEFAVQADNRTTNDMLFRKVYRGTVSTGFYPFLYRWLGRRPSPIDLIRDDITAACKDVVISLEDALPSGRDEGYWNAAKVARAERVNPTGVAPAVTVASAPVPEIVVPPGPPEKIVALLVGVPQYADPTIPKLNFPANDVQRIATDLQGLGIPEENIITLVGEQATLSEFNNTLAYTIPEKIGSADALLVYFSGHGGTEPARGGDANAPSDGVDKFLLLYDSDPKALRSTAERFDQLGEHLRELSAKRIIVMVDACYSGEGKSIASTATKSIYLQDTPAEAVASNSPATSARQVAGDKLDPSAWTRNITFIASSQANQVSQEDPNAQLGLFTNYLSQALRSAGTDENGDGWLSTREIFQSLSGNVERASRNAQTPIIRPLNEPYELKMLPAPPAQ